MHVKVRHCKPFKGRAIYMSYLFRGFFNESNYFVYTSEVKASIKVVHRQKKKCLHFIPALNGLRFLHLKFNFHSISISCFSGFKILNFVKKLNIFWVTEIFKKKSHCHVLNRWNLLTAEIVIGYMYLYLRNLLLQEFTQNISRNWVTSSPIQPISLIPHRKHLTLKSYAFLITTKEASLRKSSSKCLC